MNISLPNFSQTHILVIGDVMLDRYWHGDTCRISPEAPVPIVKVNHSEDRPGGAANVALNIVALGGNVTLIGLTGHDDNHDKLTNILHSANIQTDFVQNNHPTITKLRVISQHQQLIRLDFEEKLDHDNHQKALLDTFEKHLDKTKAIILSDYGKGVLFDAAPFIQLAKKKKIPVFVDPKRNSFDTYKNATCITPNYHEFEAVVGTCENEEIVVKKAKKLLKQTHLDYLLVTRGKDGMSLFHEDDEELHIPTKAKEVFDVTGAGDTVIATLALAYATNMSMNDSVRLANVAAGIVVGKLGSATTSLPELQKAMRSRKAGGAVNEDQLLIEIEHAKQNNKKIVFTNGCFDILHAGHVHYLSEAKKLGHYLVVAVNDDSSVKRLKGE